MNNTENHLSLEGSLMNLHLSVAKLLAVLKEKSTTLEIQEDVLDKLPLLDFYNDDLLRNIKAMRGIKD